MRKERIKVDAEKEINFILRQTEETKELLTEKGFSCGKDTIFQKIALLHTEVAELTDAFKKGKGNDQEGEEAADIIIRLTNIPCIFDSLIININENIDTYINMNEERDFIDLDLCNKYSYTYHLHREVSKLGDMCHQYLLMSSEDNYNNKVQEIYQSSIIVKMSFIITLCRLYCCNFLDHNIEYYVEDKMKKNLERPYRYNTAFSLNK